MIDFIQSNASAVFALSGAIAGALITAFFAFISKSREVKLRVAEKIIDKRITAHESTLRLCKTIRTMVLLGGKDHEGDLKRTPCILQSRENLDTFLFEFTNIQNEADSWLSTPVLKELSLFLDYFVNLNEELSFASDKALQEVGVFIRNDFITFSNDLERLTYKFFSNDLLRLKIDRNRDWHKYPREMTISRLHSTEFFRRKAELLEIARKLT